MSKTGYQSASLNLKSVKIVDYVFKFMVPLFCVVSETLKYCEMKQKQNCSQVV